MTYKINFVSQILALFDTSPTNTVFQVPKIVLSGDPLYANSQTLKP